MVMREWTDALVIAFVFAMFIRVFIVELFKIPTGSMTPTLIGDTIAEVDWNKDGLIDLIISGHQRPLVFINKGDRLEVDESARVPLEQIYKWEEDGTLKEEHDRILVSKFSYWWNPPDRGDVVVFKVPEIIWDPEKPIFIKRFVGSDGDFISFAGNLYVEGERVTEPKFFEHHEYINEVGSARQGYPEFPYVDYETAPFSGKSIRSVRVPDDSMYVLGDNTNSSLDSRYWGAVPLNHLKGKAFLRYWPINKLGFIK